MLTASSIVASESVEYQKLDEQYQKLLQMLEGQFKKFKSLMEFAFDVDVNSAFNGSIELARFNGVDEDKILKNTAEVNAYFLG